MKPGLYSNITPNANASLRAAKRRCVSLARPAHPRPKRSKSRPKQRRRNNMPLKKSATPTAFRQNVKAEVKAGKPVKQAVAIAYAVKRKAKK